MDNIEKVQAKARALQALRDLYRDDAHEVAHVAADEILCDLLENVFDCGEVVEAFQALTRWYA